MNSQIVEKAVDTSIYQTEIMINQCISKLGSSNIVLRASSLATVVISTFNCNNNESFAKSEK